MGLEQSGGAWIINFIVFVLFSVRVMSTRRFLKLSRVYRSYLQRLQAISPILIRFMQNRVEYQKSRQY